MNTVDLTIIMPTWNKEAYIRDALDSIFAQRTRFSYHIIVADDNSTDSTLDIVQEYEKRHPGFFTVLTSDQNRKLYRNVIRAYAITKTPYFCVLDPDDFWMSENHVENALSYLESHRKFSIYSSGIEMLYPDGTRKKCAFANKPTISSFDDYLCDKAVIAFTQTCVFRNVVFINGLPEKMIHLESPSNERSFRGDSFRSFIHIREGKSYYNPDIESVYRITNEGIYAGLSEASRYLLNARLFADFWQYDGAQHHELIARSKQLFNLALNATLMDVASSGQYNAEKSNMVCELASLWKMYREKENDIDKAVERMSVIRRRLYYWGYKKLRKKGIVA